MAEFFATIHAALFSLSQSIAILVNCSLLALGCSATTAPIVPTGLLSSTTTIERRISNNASETLKALHEALHLPQASSAVVTTTHSATGAAGISQFISTQTSSGHTTVTTSVNGNTTTYTAPESSGVHSVIISQTVNGETHSYASSTPISQQEADRIAQEVRDRAAALEARIRSSVEAHQRSMQQYMQTFDNF